MKTVLVACAALMISACVSRKSLQVSVVQAELVKIDTLYRNTGYIQLLTWRSPEQMEFVSYAGIKEYYPVGAKMSVFLPR